MFTGIVQGTATVRNAAIHEGILRLDLDLPNTDALVPGASVSISGVCLTAVEITPPTVRFDVIAVSLGRTTLRDLRPGSQVNVERAARFGDEIGGHVTSGHIWGIGTVTQVTRDEGNLTIRIAPPASASAYVLSKGYIAIDGASLTIGTVYDDGSFNVHLIPETLRLTTLDAAKPGTRLNIEVDAQTQAVVDTAERILSRHRALDPIASGP
ncbi:MAG: riboflavin synthase subunit alpha [Myxococcota bacterium]